MSAACGSRSSHGPIEDRRVEHEAGRFGPEFDPRLEEFRERRLVARRIAGEAHDVRAPGAPAELTHQVEGDRDRGVDNLFGAFDVGRGDHIAE